MACASCIVSLCVVLITYHQFEAIRSDISIDKFSVSICPMQIIFAAMSHHIYQPL